MAGWEAAGKSFRDASVQPVNTSTVPITGMVTFVNAQLVLDLVAGGRPEMLHTCALASVQELLYLMLSLLHACVLLS